jgi:hypothetical protein
VLLDALFALAPHRKAFIVAGAQAVYLQTGLNEIAIAPYTTDGDLALDPTLLGDDPELEATMRQAGFELWEQAGGRVQPGIWIKTEEINGQRIVVPIDLIVPSAALIDARGRRGARLGSHGKSAARRAVGLEAVLIDHEPMVIAALDPADARSISAEVAGVAALLVAKAHKIHDRVATERRDRLSDKDASDVFRIMQTTSPEVAGATLGGLLTHAVAGEPVDTALRYFSDLFGRRAGEGVAMAQRALRLAVPDDQIAPICISFTERLLVAARTGT